MKITFLQKLSKKHKWVYYITKPISYLFLIIYAIISDGVMMVAGSLTYSSLLALVPVLLVFFSILSFLPHFVAIKEGLQSVIFSVIAPSSANELADIFNNVITKTSNLGLPSILSLFVISFFLLHKIDYTINHNIWHIRRRRTIANAFTTYWTLLSFGPMLLGALMFVKSYLISTYDKDDTIVSNGIIFALNYLQLGLLFGVLLFTYTVFPLRKVKTRYGIISAVIATTVLVLVKSVFIFYITTFPTYHIIYGAIAAFPITVLWLYVVWLIIMLGASITYVLSCKDFFSLYHDYLNTRREIALERANGEDFKI